MPVSLSLRYTAVSSPQLTVSSVARTSSFPVLAPAAGAVSHSETEGGSQRCPSRAKPASPRQREPAHSCRVRTICSVVRVTLAAASASSSLRLAAPGAMPNTASMPTSCSSSMPVPICPATAMTGLPCAWRFRPRRPRLAELGLEVDGAFAGEHHVSPLRGRIESGLFDDDGDARAEFGV